jgi:glycosyltransferase involved in cell wall biosynthesis
MPTTSSTTNNATLERAGDDVANNLAQAGTREGDTLDWIVVSTKRHEMRVLYLTLNPNRLSTTVPTESWFRRLRPLGLEPVLVSSQRGAFQDWARQEGVPAYDLELPFPDRRHPVRFLRSLARLYRIARRHRVQLVHSNEHDVYPIAGYVARMLGVPKIASVHFTMDRGFCSWAFSGHRCPDRLFFVSRSSLDVCQPGLDGIVPPEDCRVLRNGVDLDRFKPDAGLRDESRRRYDLGDSQVIGVACALRPRKQLEHLFRAAATLGPHVKVLVAGGPVPGDESYADRLLAEGRALLGTRLVHLGHLDDLRGFYSALDLFVNTSQEEACSISVIESLASGCPVVGYASRSVDEQILPDAGEIVAQDDSAALAEAIRRWLSDASLLNRGRLGARQQSERLFDAKHLAAEVWAEYQALVSPAESHDA